MNYSVYMHTCPNGKKYIGITGKKPKRRWSNGSNYKLNKHFYNAIQKYGWENIEHKILLNWLSKEEAQRLEIELINYYLTYDSKYGYNKTFGGELNIPTEETRQKISDSLKGRTISNEQKEIMRNLFLGRKNSEQSKIKMSIAKKGKARSEETKQKISDSLKGRKLTQETKLKLSQIKCIKVIKYDLDGNFISNHNSLLDAAKSVNKKSSRTISKCLIDKEYQAYGYRWEYAEEQNIKED